MELRHIRYFLAVAEESNFTRAAARVGIGQPPLSQQIKDLEAELDAQLFRRLPHGAELTAAGEAFLVEARIMMAVAERARIAAQRAARGDVGGLRIGFTGSAAFNTLVPGAIRDFARSYPGVSLDLVEANTSSLLERLGSGELDAAFLRPNDDKYDVLRLRKIVDEPMLLVLASSHKLAHRVRITLAELASDRFVLFPRVVGPRLHDAITGACRTAGFEPLLGQEVPQIPSIINLVAAEAGVSIVPSSLAQIKVDGVVYIPIEGAAPTARLVLAWRRDARATTLANFPRGRARAGVTNVALRKRQC